ncbi:MAG: NERD domain-containing protein [Anaerolineae bacterium]|nr:NERD domain-containing protein [Anaerolineae bacterium]
MEVIANESHIRIRRKIGERAPLVGLLLLVVSTVLVFMKPEWIWGTMALVWVGFLVSLTGSYLGERYVGPNAHHKRVPEALKGLSSEYTLLVYELASPFVLVEPGGLTVISVKSQAGEIAYQNGRWQHKQHLGILRRFAGQESLGRPDRLADAEVEMVKRDLSKRLTAHAAQVPVRGVVVFTHPDVVLTVDAEAAPMPALRAAELKRWLRRNPLKPVLPDEVQNALQEALGLEAGAPTR